MQVRDARILNSRSVFAKPNWTELNRTKSKPTRQLLIATQNSTSFPRQNIFLSCDMDSINRLDHIIKSLVQYRKLWLSSIIVGLVIATVYAFLLTGRSWTARQSMIIRDNLLGQTFKPGQFLSEEAMKSAQETVLETSRRPEVIAATLEKLGPDRTSLFGLGGSSNNWPSQQDIEDYRGAVSFQAANGAEFGKSEVIVLAAKSSSPERSIKFLTILLDEVDRKLGDIRGDQFRSMENEIAATLDSAKKAMSDLAVELEEMEGWFGSDLPLVRSINGVQGGATGYDNKINQILADKRRANQQLASLVSMRDSLRIARNNPDAEIPTTAELLAAQPTIAAMMASLAKVKENLALKGDLKSKHPDIKAGHNTIESMKQQIRAAIGPTINGLEDQIAMKQDEVGSLDERLEQYSVRLKELSSRRVQYMTLEQEVSKRREDYSEAMARLSEVRSRSESSHAVQLLTRMGDPWVGTRADGLGKRTLALLGGIGGLVVGLGLVMIFAPPFDESKYPNDSLSESQTAEADTVRTSESGQSVRHRQESRATEPEPALASAMSASETRETTAENQSLSSNIKPETDQVPVDQAAAEPTRTQKETVSPSLASIFANMPQPDTSNLTDRPAEKVSVTADTVVTSEATAPESAPKPAPIPEGVPTVVNVADESTASANDSEASISDQINKKIEAFKYGGSSPSKPPSAPEPRTPSETIQLEDFQPAKTEPLPLQRRSNVRPVDLAKSVEPEMLENGVGADRSTIDNAFSQLEARSRNQNPE
jgi:uncharacterized protein involved in exopolysaccharide biosynthesis